MTTMEPQVLVSVRDGSGFVFGDPEMRLLEAISLHGTLTTGAASLGLSYRCAWGKIKTVETKMGRQLIESTVGGAGGGSSRLAVTAQRLLDQYGRFRAAVGDYALREFERCFAGEPA